MLCFRILYLNRILKQSKKTYYVEEEIPNRKMKMKTTKKMKRKLYIRLLYHHQNYCERESSLHHFICETSDIHGDRRDCVRIKLLFSTKIFFVFNFAFICQIHPIVSRIL